MQNNSSVANNFTYFMCNKGALIYITFCSISVNCDCREYYDIVDFTETWFNSIFHRDFVSIRVYNFMYLSCPTSGGVIGIYFRHRYNYYLILQYISSSSEHI